MSREDQAEQSRREKAIQARVAELTVLRPLSSAWARVSRRGGVASAFARGVVGSSRWGWQMRGRRFGLVNARHGLEHLRRISPLGVRARLIAAERRKARAQWEQEHPEA